MISETILDALLVIPEHKPAAPAEARALTPMEAVRAFCAWSRRCNSGRADADDVGDDCIVEMLRDGIAIRRARRSAKADVESLLAAGEAVHPARLADFEPTPLPEPAEGDLR